MGHHINTLTPSFGARVIPKGGQVPPISIAGDKLEWKNAQNIDRKANNSLIINNTIPNINPFFTSVVWCPK